MTPVSPRTLAPALAGLLAAVPPATASDVLVLEGGRRMEVDAWWEADGQILYRKYGGVVGIPTEVVVRVEAGDDGSDRLAGAPPTAGIHAPRPPAEEVAGGRSDAHADGPEGPGAATLADRAMAAWQRGDAAESIRLLERALGLDPRLLPARLQLAAALLAEGRHGEARAEAERALLQEPTSPEALLLHGEALYRDERVAEAIDAWARAQDLAPSRRVADRLAKARREQAASAGYLQTGAAHFTLRHEGGGRAPELGVEILAFLEERLEAMVPRYNHLPPAPIVVILYPREAFHEVTETPGWTGGLFDGKIRVPVGTARRLDRRLERVLVHELTHAVVHTKSRGRCPAWLQEGLAQMEEGRRTSPATRESLGRQYRREGGEGWGTSLDYAAALAFTEHLVARHGFGALMELLDRLGGGTDEEEALRRSLGTGYHGLLLAWGEALGEPGPA